jgi:hypothetical protein
MTVRLLAFTLSCSIIGAACGDDGGGTIDARPSADAAGTSDAPVSIDAPAAVDGGDPDAITDDAMVADASDNDADTTDGNALIAPIINEAVKEHTGTNDMEFVEIFGTPNTDYSMYTIITLDGDVGTGLNAGQIDSVHPVGTTDANGLWVTPFLTSQLENGSQTFLLVHGFTGADNDDLDTDDNGTLDVTPWNAIVDAVAIDDESGGDAFYAGLAIVPGDVGGASRIPNGTDTNAASDWKPNVFNMAMTPAAGEAFHTPGAVNNAN